MSRRPACCSTQEDVDADHHRQRQQTRVTTVRSMEAVAGQRSNASARAAVRLRRVSAESSKAKMQRRDREHEEPPKVSYPRSRPGCRTDIGAAATGFD